jgi:Concanavalin A-like lectin/glucanases superfamily
MPATSFPRIALLIAVIFLVSPTPATAEDPPLPWGNGPHDPPPPPEVDAGSTSPDRVVYSNDFETTSGREWSPAFTDTTPNGRQRFLGQFGNDSVVLTLTGLPAHQSVLVTFDLYILRTWDGDCGDTWQLGLVDGRTLFRTTFSNMHEFGHRQAYPGVSPGGSHPARTGAHERNTLGYRHGGKARDSVYKLAFTFEHADRDLRLNFKGLGLQDLADESWGLDNVRVIVRNEPREMPPEPERALVFDGVDDCVTIQNSPSLDLKGSLTLEARVKVDGDEDGQIIWRGDTRAEHDPYELHVHEGHMEFRVDTVFRGRIRLCTVRSRKPVDGKWHWWAGVCDRTVGMLYLYRDGVLEAATEFVGEITYDTSEMWNMIGAVDHGTSQNLKGSIREVRIWNDARSAAEIRSHLTGNLTGKQQGLVAWWRLDHTVGQIE